LHRGGSGEEEKGGILYRRGGVAYPQRRSGSTGALLPLQHPLYQLLDQVARLPLHLGRLGLVRIVRLEEVLHLSDVG
jgi:hypothetical protein